MRKIFEFIERDHTLILHSLLAVSLAAGLAAFAYLGFFSRYGADDYCFTRALFQYGNMLDAAWWWYIHTSNRYTTMFLVGISEWFGRSAISYLPALAILLWTVGLTWALSTVSTLVKLPRPRLTGFILAALSIFFALWQAPNRYQSLYWRAGLVTYLTPLIFLSYLAAILLHASSRPPRGRLGHAAISILVALGFFAAGGLSETTLAMQIGALGLALFAVLLLARSDKRKHLIVLLITGLLASLLGLLVVFLAPANQFRIEVFGEPPPMMVITQKSLRFAWDFIYVTAKSLPTPTLLTLLTSLALGWTLHNPNLKMTRRAWFAVPLGSILVAYLLIVCAMAPSLYGQGTYPGARSLTGAQFVLVLATINVGLFTGLGLRQWTEGYISNPNLVSAATLLATILLIFSFAYNAHVTNQVISLEHHYQKRAIAWDARDMQIRQAISQGETDLIVEELDSIGGIREYSTKVRWVNRCVADFYGLNTIVTYP
jgi:hypothetical protein